MRAARSLGSKHALPTSLVKPLARADTIIDILSGDVDPEDVYSESFTLYM